MLRCLLHNFCHRESVCPDVCVQLLQCQPAAITVSTSTVPALHSLAMQTASEANAVQLAWRSNAPRVHIRRISHPRTLQRPVRRTAAHSCTQRVLQCGAQAQDTIASPSETQVLPEADTQGMPEWLDGLKWDSGGLVAVIAQASVCHIQRLCIQLLQCSALRHSQYTMLTV